MDNSATYNIAMVIDDNPFDLYISELVITKSRFAGEVILMESASKALDYLRSSVNSPERLPDFIFLDIRMPEIDGFEFLDQYSELPEIIKKNCIILMLSSSLDPQDHKRAVDNKYVNRFLNKPLSREVLEEVEFEKSFRESRATPVDSHRDTIPILT